MSASERRTRGDWSGVMTGNPPLPACSIGRYRLPKRISKTRENAALLLIWIGNTRHNWKNDPRPYFRFHGRMGRVRLPIDSRIRFGYGDEFLLTQDRMRG